jgi:hypothetical protein
MLYDHDRTHLRDYFSPTPVPSFLFSPITHVKILLYLKNLSDWLQMGSEGGSLMGGVVLPGKINESERFAIADIRLRILEHAEDSSGL